MGHRIRLNMINTWPRMRNEKLELLPLPSAMSNPSTAKLTALVKVVEDLRTDFATYRGKTSEAMKLLRLQNAELTEKLEDSEDKIEWIAKVLQLEEALNGGKEAVEDEPQEETGGDPHPGESEEGGVSSAHVEESAALKDSKPIRVSKKLQSWIVYSQVRKPGCSERMPQDPPRHSLARPAEAS